MRETETFEKLEVFQRAYRVSLGIHRRTLEFPKAEQYALADQMRWASKGIAAAIAEGYGKRSSKAEFNRYLQIAIGSADEMRVWLRYSKDLGYISEAEWRQWRDEYQAIAKMLNGLSQSL